MLDALRAWPRRRWLAAAITFPAMVGLFALTSRAGSAARGVPLWTWPWTVVVGLLAATVLASYLAPAGAGRLIEVGCSPCAAVAALAVAGAVVAHAAQPSSPTMAVVGLFLTAAAARQRLNDARTCQTPRPSVGQPDRQEAARS